MEKRGDFKLQAGKRLPPSETIYVKWPLKGA
jgi:hypothetical protein